MPRRALTGGATPDAPVAPPSVVTTGAGGCPVATCGAIAIGWPVPACGANPIEAGTTAAGKRLAVPTVAATGETGAVGSGALGASAPGGGAAGTVCAIAPSAAITSFSVGRSAGSFSSSRATS